MKRDWRFAGISLLIGALAALAAGATGGFVVFTMAAILAWLRSRGPAVRWSLTGLAIVFAAAAALVLLDATTGHARLGCAPSAC